MASEERVWRGRMGELELKAGLLDLIHDNLIVRDADDRVTFWNRAAEKTYGWSAAEAVGRDSHALLATRFPEPLERIEERLLGEGRWEGELEHKKRCGGRVVVASRWVLERDEHDEPAAILETNNDITEHKRAEERLRRSEQMFGRIFEEAGVGLALLAPDGRWLKVNGKLREISGYTERELMSMTFLDLTPPEDRPASMERVRGLLEGKLKPYTMERRYVRKSDRRVWVNLSVELFRKPGGEPDFFYCVAEDITEKKLVEEVPDPLTDREMEVLRLIARWHTNKEIARDLGYSEGTIKSDVQHILAKLGPKNRRQAAARAVEIGLIPPPL